MEVDSIAVRGRWWRQVPHGSDPLFRATPPSDGRWQHGEAVGGFYLADEQDTAWAEWYRALAELAVPPDRQMPRDLWGWDVDVSGVADLSSAERLAAVGLDHPRPGQRRWPSFQAVGEALWRAGHRGVLTLSAARPAYRVFCLFRENDEVPGATPVRPALTYRRPPAPPTGMTT